MYKCKKAAFFSPQILFKLDVCLLHITSKNHPNSALLPVLTRLNFITYRKSISVVYQPKPMTYTRLSNGPTTIVKSKYFVSVVLLFSDDLLICFSVFFLKRTTEQYEIYCKIMIRKEENRSVISSTDCTHLSGMCHECYSHCL